MDRKYRHNGYMDHRDEPSPEGTRPPRQELTLEEKIQRRSMRKATTREANDVLRCHACGRNVTDLDAIAEKTVCPFCTAALHCCRACTHFDTSARWQCRAEIAEPVSDKNQGNRCARYEPRMVLDTTGRRNAPSTQGKSDDPRSQFENLFRR